MKRRISGFILCALVALCALSFVACDQWEKQTYQTLAASKATIDQAILDYNAGKLPQTVELHNAIGTASQAQATAVEAFKSYALLKYAHKTADAQQQKQAVVELVTSTLSAVGHVRTLLGNK